jgi:hypothetical protein
MGIAGGLKLESQYTEVKKETVKPTAAKKATKTQLCTNKPHLAIGKISIKEDAKYPSYFNFF